MRRIILISLAGVVLAGMAACDLVDPARPAAQPDEIVYGNLLEVSQSEAEPNEWTALIRVGPPRALLDAEEEAGQTPPPVQKGLQATVTVTGDTVVVYRDLPAALEEIDPGTEVAVVPVAGTTRMIGSDDLRLEASTLMDFASYRRWRLPGLKAEDESEVNRADLINSGGAEVAPVPLRGGRILYFTSHLRPPAGEDDEWHGAVRDGLVVPDEENMPLERSYRTELGEDGWSPPALVRFPGLDEAPQIRVTWVSADELQCLVTVSESGQQPWVGQASRERASAPWGPPQRLEFLGDGAHDAVYLTGSTKKIVFVATMNGTQGDLLLYDPGDERSPLPLQPQICTLGNEWNPRTGPANELFFCREDRQLVFADGRVRALALPGPQRTVFTQGAPTDDGKWLFLCIPRFRPVELDQDIYVAPLGGDLTLGKPVAVDAWRP